MKAEIDMTALNAFYRGIAELLGTEAMLKLHTHYRGMQMTIPIHLYDRQLVAQSLRKQYNGHNGYELARKYGYSQRWVTKMLRQASQTDEA
ncbi:Mor transcription activator family protein [Lactiplantibacillus sp. DA1]|uniref:Mor transcription activator domain-containing protein n=1 Tax=Lactiplantibacillus paraplantarum TaxID=60520 RepID=A0A4Q9XYY5_9LACO|nr:Mor transcription activator family protein [Lactiplantibacillus sp. DA1]MDV0430513.1 Mor transcription activator family protein [Lactiplantibacillus sp. DA1]TBX38645.1 hypothetical protein EUZ87_13115 [Lactiplantibacillus paraplantarum]